MTRFGFAPSSLASAVVALVATIVVPACTDPERCRIGSESCVCEANGTCDSGLACLEGKCVDEGTVICEEACFYQYNGDGSCDDGDPTAMYVDCGFGTDCSDCGARRNPCTGTAYPVYCPQSAYAQDPESACWGANTDCDSITWNPNDSSFHACMTGYRYDVDTDSCVTSVCTDPSYPVFCDIAALNCDSSPTAAADCCFAEHADCRTVTECYGSNYVCIGRLANDVEQLQVDCGASASEIDCIRP